MRQIFTYLLYLDTCDTSNMYYDVGVLSKSAKIVFDRFRSQYECFTCGTSDTGPWPLMCNFCHSYSTWSNIGIGPTQIGFNKGSINLYDFDGPAMLGNSFSLPRIPRPQPALGLVVLKKTYCIGYCWFFSFMCKDIHIIYRDRTCDRVVRNNTPTQMTRRSIQDTNKKWRLPNFWSYPAW